MYKRRETTKVRIMNLIEPIYESMHPRNFFYEIAVAAPSPSLTGRYSQTIVPSTRM